MLPQWYSVLFVCLAINWLEALLSTPAESVTVNVNLHLKMRPDINLSLQVLSMFSLVSTHTITQPPRAVTQRKDDKDKKKIALQTAQPSGVSKRFGVENIVLCIIFTQIYLRQLSWVRHQPLTFKFSLNFCICYYFCVLQVKRVLF